MTRCEASLPGGANRLIVCSWGMIRRVPASGWLSRATVPVGELPEADLFRINVKSNDRAYWSKVRAFLEWISLGLTTQRRNWPQAAYKELRRGHHGTSRVRLRPWPARSVSGTKAASRGSA